VVNYFDERMPEKGIDTKFLYDVIGKLVNKYNIERIIIHDEIIDH